MPPDPLTDDDEQYVSADDSDFAPDEAPEAASSDSEGEGPAGKKRKQISAAEADGIDAADADNSGDEAIISRGKKKLKRSKEAAEDEGGEGGLVKTRAQRAVEKEERKYAVNNGPVTIDVDALWAQMQAGQTFTPPTKEAQSEDATKAETADQPAKNADEDMIRIKRTYNFAGKVHTEEKMVPRDSAEAKLYLESEEGKAPLDASPPKRATRKAFRSAFEPITDALAKRSDLNLGMAARLQASKDAEAKKLNTVEKSRMDWAGYVDKEGIKDELKVAGKSKHSYAARQDFLARSEALREEESRRARMAGRT